MPGRDREPKRRARGVSLRPATWKDCDLLLAWRDDPMTRANSGDQNPVSQSEHEAWLSPKLTDPNCKLMIAEVGHRPVGTVRADRKSNAWWLSWSVDRTQRGRGYGRAMVAEMLARLDGQVRAMTRTGNVPSKRIALTIGMVCYEERGGFEYWKTTIGPKK